MWRTKASNVTAASSMVVEVEIYRQKEKIGDFLFYLRNGEIGGVGEIMVGNRGGQSKKKRKKKNNWEEEQELTGNIAFSTITI